MNRNNKSDQFLDLIHDLLKLKIIFAIVYEVQDKFHRPDSTMVKKETNVNNPILYHLT